jgi:hypothetical protein
MVKAKREKTPIFEEILYFFQESVYATDDKNHRNSIVQQLAARF